MRAPVFAVPGHNGDVFAYRELAQHVGEDQPFFALHPPGLDDGAEPSTRTHDLAAYFAAQIVAFQGSKPCIVAGYCAGGAIALELARELERRGVQVLFLALFGCIYPPAYRFRRQIPYWLMRMALHVRAAARPASFAARCRYLAARLSARLKAYRAAQSPTGTDPLSLTKFRFEQAFGKSVFAYRPRPFAGRVCLFLPNRAWLREGEDALRYRNGALGWRKVAPRLEQYYGPDTVDPDRMLINADGPVFAELFRQCRDLPESKAAPRPEAVRTSHYANADGRP